MVNMTELLSRKPFLDVLIPHYNDLAGFRLSLESVRAQDWSGAMRLVVVDDGSEESAYFGVKKLLEESELPHTLLKNDTNRGRPYTRNRLLGAIDGAYVAWLDAGDIWYPGKISSQFEHLVRLHLEGQDVDKLWITCSYDWKWEGRRARTIEQITDGPQFKGLMLGQDLRAYLWTLLGTSESFRKAGRFDERLPRLQDLDYFLRFVRSGGHIESLPSPLAFCRYHKTDLGRNAREIRRCNKLIYDKNLPALEAFGPRFMRTIKYNAESLSARFAWHNRDFTTWTKYRISAALTDPRRQSSALNHFVRTRW